MTDPTYTLQVHVREAEPYTGLADYEEIHEALLQEATNTVNDLGSDILETGSDEEREAKAKEIADDAIEELWRSPRPGKDRTEYRLPGGPRRGILLSLTQEREQ
jgi:hypothetical protein